jgi:hypothetical protein
MKATLEASAKENVAEEQLEKSGLLKRGGKVYAQVIEETKLK